MSATGSLLIGIITAWPPAFAGIALSWYLANRKVRSVTDAQTAQIREMTTAQTSTLLESAPYQGGGAGAGSSGNGGTA